MTKTDSEIRSQILSFAAHLQNDSDNDATITARRHGWLDESGEPTAEGRKLVKALGEQVGTRSTFRGAF